MMTRQKLKLASIYSYGLDISLDMLTGNGQYIDPISQSIISQYAISNMSQI